MSKSAPEMSHDVLLTATQRLHRLSMQRSYLFCTNLFKNPPWLVTLTLFESHLTGLPMTAAAITLANSLTDAEYQDAIGQLMDAGIVRLNDDDIPEMMPIGCTQMTGFIREIMQSWSRQN